MILSDMKKESHEKTLLLDRILNDQNHLFFLFIKPKVSIKILGVKKDS